MTNALFRKQMMEVFSWLYKDKKSGKLRTIKEIAGYVLLYLLLFGFLGVMFGFAATALCAPLLSMNMGWLYWCLMGLISIFFGVFGSVFNTYSSLYQAKDNDLLLSMPLPTSRILLVRLSGVYAMGLMYEMIAMIPAVIVWFGTAPFSALGTIHVLLIPILLSVLILVLSAVLGWVVALIAARVKHKNILTVVISLCFIGAYYYVYGMAYSMLQTILANAEMIGHKMQIVLYPLYHMGLAAAGNVLSMLIFAAWIGILFAVTYWALSKSFLKLATVNRGTAKTAYKEQTAKAGSVNSALLRKELQRFTSSANYMLNCGLGIILMPISAILLVWKADMIRALFPMLPTEVLPLLAIGAVCLLTSMNDMAAPSISLEGKNLWIAQSFPLSGRQVLTAKLKLHLILTLLPAIAPIVAVEWLLKPEPIYALALPLLTALFVLLMAMIGLALNLKMPNLHWSSEIIPIKQSVPVMIALFGGWLLIVGLAGIYVLLQRYISAMAYLLCLVVLLLAADSILLHWLMTKGARVFEKLS